MNRDLLKAREVAERVGISIRTVWQWTSAGLLPAPFRLGRVTRWRTRDIHEYLMASPRFVPPKKPA